MKAVPDVQVVQSPDRVRGPFNRLDLTAVQGSKFKVQDEDEIFQRVKVTREGCTPVRVATR